MQFINFLVLTLCRQAHKEAAVLYGKSFPFFNDLISIFTKEKSYGDTIGNIGDYVG